MIIKRLKLSNFRQFAGDQELIFSIDPSKKTTLVIAENGTGKTTIIEAFSWILYGKITISSILNTYTKEHMDSGDSTVVSGEIVLEHLSREYTIKRSQKFIKSGRMVKENDPILIVNYKNTDGITREVRGMDAQKEIESIVPSELFPYFFFKGENIEKIGREINNSKDAKNNEFVKAIRGMLGFNWLYQTAKDLKTLSGQYNEEIASNETEGKLAELAVREKKAENNISKCEEEIEIFNNQIVELEARRESLNAKLLKVKDVANKQQKSRELVSSLSLLQNNIDELQRDLFSNISRNSYALFSENLIQQALALVEKEGGNSKDIPGLTAAAIEYLLDKGECICGTKISKDTPACKKLEELIDFLPPHNVGNEIAGFKEDANKVIEDSQQSYAEFNRQRKDLRAYREEYNLKAEELNRINDEIKGSEDATNLKKQEEGCTFTINSYNQQLGSAKNNLEIARNELNSVRKDSNQYVVTDSRNKKVLLCKRHVDVLIRRIENYCASKEAAKREQLQDAINSIYQNIFDSSISIELDDQYNINKTDSATKNITDVEASTSQDAIMAFSFIGGIIKLARDDISNTSETSKDEFHADTTEPYPLVMDAPSSSFDIKRIQSFCKLMPNIAEQVILFMKDTDGLYVEKYLSETIGHRYKFVQMDTYHTEIREK